MLIVVYCFFYDGKVELRDVLVVMGKKRIVFFVLDGLWCVVIEFIKEFSISKILGNICYLNELY